jgi:predicted aminopeptidase
MALGSYGTALGWLGSETGKSSIRVFFDYNQLCTGKVELLTRRCNVNEVITFIFHDKMFDHRLLHFGRWFSRTMRRISVVAA